MTELFANVLPAPESLALVGRIKKALSGQEGVLPVSCTSEKPSNRVLGSNSWVESFIYVSRALRGAAGVAVSLDEFKYAGPLVTNLKWRPYIELNHPDVAKNTLPSRFLTPPKESDYVIQVSDSMQAFLGDGGIPIEQSWAAFVTAAYEFQEEGREIVVDLSRLRPSGSENGKGLMASGPVSFLTIYFALARYLQQGTIDSLINVYSELNSCLRRGGAYKNGAVVCHLPYYHKSSLDFMKVSREDSAYARLGICIDEGFLDFYKENTEAVNEVMLSGDMFVTKIEFDKNGVRLLPNVCLEIRFISRATCLLAHIPLNRLKHSEIEEAIESGMDWLTDFHPHTGVETMGFYKHPSNDRQVGLGFLGLASHLAYYGVKYSEFVDALEFVLTSEGVRVFEPRPITPKYRECETTGEWILNFNEHALKTSYALLNGVRRAADIAKKKNFERAFTIAPTATCSFNERDFFGYTATPEITPPIDTSVDRESEVFGIQHYEYNPDCERAEQVGWPVFFRLNCLFQSLFDSTGLGHAISTNWWPDQVEFGEAFLREFIQSPLKSLYYAQPVQSKVQDKTVIQQQCLSCAE